MKILGKTVDWIEDHMLLILMIVMPLVVICQIVLRTIGGSLSWTEETARYMFIWVIYLGCSRGVRMRSELSVDMVRMLLKEESRARAVYDVITACLCVVFAAVFVRYSIAMIESLMRYPKHSAACNYNMIIVYLSSVVSSILMLLRYAHKVYLGLRLVVHPQAASNGDGGAST